jgi:hypothetical protein
MTQANEGQFDDVRDSLNAQIASLQDRVDRLEEAAAPFVSGEPIGECFSDEAQVMRTHTAKEYRNLFAALQTKPDAKVEDR